MFLSIIKVFIVIVFILSPLPATAREKSVSIALYSYYPFLLDNSSDKGYAYDIAKAALTRSGYEVTEQFMPLQRAIRQTIGGKYDVILGLNPSHTSDIAFSQSPLTSLKFMIWGRKKSNWYYESIDNLRNVEVLTVSGFDYTSADKEYQQYIEGRPGNVQVLYGNDAIPRAFRMIHSNRADIFALDIDQAAMVLEELGLADQFKTVGELQNLYCGYFGVSKTHPRREEMLEAFETGLAKIRESGQMDEIVQRYMKKYNLQHRPL